MNKKVRGSIYILPLMLIVVMVVSIYWQFLASVNMFALQEQLDNAALSGANAFVINQDTSATSSACPLAIQTFDVSKTPSLTINCQIFYVVNTLTNSSMPVLELQTSFNSKTLTSKAGLVPCGSEQQCGKVKHVVLL